MANYWLRSLTFKAKICLNFILKDIFGLLWDLTGVKW